MTDTAVYSSTFPSTTFSQLHGMICYEGRTWPKPTDKLMKLLMCKEGKDNHSYVYVCNAKGEWEFKKNGFYYAGNRSLMIS